MLFCFIQRTNKISVFKRALLVYGISSIPALLFLCWHFYEKGWIIQTQQNSPWAAYASMVNLKGFIRNIVIICQRYGDFGRCFIIAFIIFVLFRNRKNISRQPQIILLLLLSICSVFFIAVYSLLSTNAMAHRYFLPSFITIILLAFLLLKSYLNKSQNLIYALLFGGLLTGNFWVYPEGIAQGWDASLAHMPYFNLRKQAIDYLDDHNISLQQTGTFFPNIHTLNDITLNGDLRSFAPFTGSNKYVFTLMFLILRIKNMMH